MVQLEDIFELLREVTVQVGEKPEDAEESGDDNERDKIAG
jgi:hypothetical protein